MSGSTDAATIAERTKLEAELRNKKEDLEDTYYDHAMTSQSDALDEELESFTEAKETYIEGLRETLENMEQVVSDTMASVLINADSVLTGLNGVANKYGITLSDQLMLPWQKSAQKATEYKNSALADLANFTTQNGIYSGVITQQIQNTFGAGSISATNFQTTVTTVIGQIQQAVELSRDPLKNGITFSWEEALKYAQHTFSPGVAGVLDAEKQKAIEVNPSLEENMTNPWEEGTDAANTFKDSALNTLNNVANKAKATNPSLTADLTIPPMEGSNKWSMFGNTVQNALSGMITKAEQARVDIGADMNEIISKAQSAANAISNAYGAGGNGSGGDTNNNGGLPAGTKASLQTSLKLLTTTISDKSRAKESLLLAAYNYYKEKGYSDEKIYNFQTKTWEKNIKYYAKGTMGATKDHWAITDEPWLGDELTLVPGKNGNLSFIRKGTSIIPADLTERLVELAQEPINSIGTNLVKVSIPDVNTSNNIELTFDTLLKVENATKESIPELKKLVQEQLDIFSRKLNYGIKRVGAN
jgi:hypothetical protein